MTRNRLTPQPHKSLSPVGNVPAQATIANPIAIYPSHVRSPPFASTMSPSTLSHTDAAEGL